ncbi:hypothetical protein TUM12149_22080 [Morganella morganii]|nr:hypothetical protein TUM12149_22080 [Morganella morganii]
MIGAVTGCAQKENGNRNACAFLSLLYIIHYGITHHSFLPGTAGVRVRAQNSLKYDGDSVPVNLNVKMEEL